jgi:hypothetical protein
MSFLTVLVFHPDMYLDIRQSTSQTSDEKFLKLGLQLKIAVLCLACLLHTPEIPGTNLGPKTVCAICFLS